MPASRVMPTEEATDLLHLVRDLAAKELAPRAAADEASETFPRDVFRLLGRAGLLGLPYSEEYGGGGQPHEGYLQAVGGIGRVWASIRGGLSVHGPRCFRRAARGTRPPRKRGRPGPPGGGAPRA